MNVAVESSYRSNDIESNNSITASTSAQLKDLQVRLQNSETNTFIQNATWDKLDDVTGIGFDSLKKVSYFSRSRADALFQDAECVRQISVLQTILIETGCQDRAEEELNRSTEKRNGKTFLETLESSSVAANFVSVLRRMKTKEGYSYTASGVSRGPGYFDTKTSLAVAYMQWVSGISVDGAFGKQSAQTLQNVLAVIPPEKALFESDIQLKKGMLRDDLVVIDSFINDLRGTTATLYQFSLNKVLSLQSNIRDLLQKDFLENRSLQFFFQYSILKKDIDAFKAEANI